MDLSPGLSARVELVVGDADTAQTLGSGDVGVLGTPRVLALCEAATVAATAPRLPAGATTVGAHVELSHRLPSAIGAVVVAKARLAKRDGKRLTFEVTVTQGETVIADGRIERVVVSRHDFLRRAAEAL
ncbi:MAG: thioesterase [Micromonosporaceae bacterium]|nr:thioesterase [Micromonosporaceae bacterium]